jgi:hypothetical protein
MNKGSLQIRHNYKNSGLYEKTLLERSRELAGEALGE